MELVEILRLGVDAWNEWYRRNHRVLVDLTGADLRCMNLSKAHLGRAILRNADLRYTELRWTDLRGADLNGARLERTNLRGARLAGALGLTPEQLGAADGDATTELPWGIRHPAHWVGRSDGAETMEKNYQSSPKPSPALAKSFGGDPVF